MLKSANKKPLLKKQIPTVVGLAVLLVALIAGTMLFSNGTGVFAPRATPETTPQNIRFSNVTDKTFTVSFYTPQASSGFIKYGTKPDGLSMQSQDDRDQLSGSVTSYSLHHITVRGLQASTNYYFTLGTSSGSKFDDGGKPFEIKTSANPTSPPPASRTIYGSVANPGGTPAEGSIVYISVDGGGDLSSLVRASGSWAVSLANARTADGSNYLEIGDTQPLNVFVQGTELSQTTQYSATAAQSQPMTDLILGQQAAPPTDMMVDNQAAASDVMADESMSSPGPTDEMLQDSQDQEMAADDSTTAQETTDSALAELDAAASSQSTLDLTAADDVIVAETTAQPKIVGSAAPNVSVTIEVHSETAISETVISDSAGAFELNLSEISQTLEPGEHTVTYTYTDPESGEEVTKTHTFTVEGEAQQLAMADTSDAESQLASTTDTSIPYGSGNPLPVNTGVGSALEEEATDSGDTASRSSVVSTSSGVLTAGSVGTTLALIIGGAFFIFTGIWSWWLAGQFDEKGW